VRQVLLDVSDHELTRRIRTDAAEPGACAWRLDHVPAWAVAGSWLAATSEVVVDTTSLNVEQVADEVLAAFRP
jgi:hypothetical protein